MQVEKSHFVFNGSSSLEFGLTVAKPYISKRPKPIITEVTVPGRGRTVIYDDGVFDNAEISYETWCREEEKDRILAQLGDVAMWLAGTEYKTLSDTYDPEYFRLAWCSSPIDPDILLRKAAKQTVKFSCDPYRYSWAGENYVRCGGSTMLYNTGWTSLPYMRLSAPGAKITVSVSSEGYAWSGEFDCSALVSGEYLEIDSFEMKTILNGESKDNLKSGDGYPVFHLGTINVSVYPASYVSDFQIKPRWRIL